MAEVRLGQLRSGDRFRWAIDITAEEYIVLKPHRGLRGAVQGSILVASLNSGHTYPAKSETAVIRL